jgi:hypothetical protein
MKLLFKEISKEYFIVKIVYNENRDRYVATILDTGETWPASSRQLALENVFAVSEKTAFKLIHPVFTKPINMSSSYPSLQECNALRDKFDEALNIFSSMHQNALKGDEYDDIENENKIIGIITEIATALGVKDKCIK